MTTLESIFEIAKTAPSGEVKLHLKYGTKTLERGAHVPKQDAPAPPELVVEGGGKGPFLAVALDLDPPYESFPVLAPIVHLIQSDLVKGEDGALTHDGNPPIGDWVQPAPPPLSGPHRYVIVLYQQPLGFDATKFGSAGKMPITQRIRWSLADFVKKAGLGEPLAANYFTSN